MTEHANVRLTSCIVSSRKELRGKRADTQAFSSSPLRGGCTVEPFDDDEQEKQ